MSLASGIVEVSRVIELAGIAVMVLGFVLAGVLAASELRARSSPEMYRAVRCRLGRSILLGLELLIAADIVRTVSEMPSLEEVAVLAAIVGIRTFLSFTLEIELTGRLPWRDRPAAAEHGRGAGRAGEQPRDGPAAGGAAH